MLKNEISQLEKSFHHENCSQQADFTQRLERLKKKLHRTERDLQSHRNELSICEERSKDIQRQQKGNKCL